MPSMSDYPGSMPPLEALEFFVRAPVENPEMVPTVIPLVLGLVIIELYFGKHEDEELGWNTSVANAVIWVSTGISLYVTETLNQNELYATGALVLLGSFVAYMNFFHKWSPSVAYTVSSAGIIHTLAYILVVFVKTDLVPTHETLVDAAVFFAATFIVFKFVKALETPQRQEPW